MCFALFRCEAQPHIGLSIIFSEVVVVFKSGFRCIVVTKTLDMNLPVIIAYTVQTLTTQENECQGLVT